MQKILLLVLLTVVTINSKAQQNKTVQTLISEATTKAKAENKKVLVRFTASWCIWCKRMEAAMTDSTTKALFDKTLIVVPITIKESKRKESLETPGGDSLYNAYGGANTGLPYWVILNTKALLIANSKIKPDDKPLTDDGDNVGCPAKPEEIAYFLKVLQSSTTLNSKELKIIETRFAKINAVN
jgi:thiol-disulfide isomerase/thioredoxin